MLSVRVGSTAQNLVAPIRGFEEPPDIDLAGIVIAPLEYYFGASTWTQTQEKNGIWDITFYELRKFVGMLCQQNPAALTVLWTPDEAIEHETYAGHVLRGWRNVFRHRTLAFQAFRGFSAKLLRDVRTPATAGIGPKRRALYEAHGWPTLSGAHLIRTLHMGEEYLRTGQLIVRRETDRERLLAIKTGSVPLHEVEEEAREGFAQLLAALANSPLPNAIDHTLVDSILVNLIRGWHMTQSDLYRSVTQRVM